MFARAPTKYYEILGVSKNTLPADLKPSYRKAAIKNHPDKGGDPEKFMELAQAYKVLSDPVKRRIYDLYGEDVLKEGMGSGSTMGLGQKMGQDIVLPQMVTLEHLYNGTSLKLPFKRYLICTKCMGTGETIDETIGDKVRCQQCKGEKAVLEKKALEVHVEKGMQTGQMITFPAEALNTGIALKIVQKEHPKFKRKGDDLFVEHTLSLKEALSGFQFRLAHLDNRQLIIKSQPGEVVKPVKLHHSFVWNTGSIFCLLRSWVVCVKLLNILACDCQKFN